MKRVSILILIFLLIAAFVYWCYWPQQNTKLIAFKMRVPLPKLYSRCLLQLGEIGTEEAAKLLANEFHRDSRSKRILEAKANRVILRWWCCKKEMSFIWKPYNQ